MYDRVLGWRIRLERVFTGEQAGILAQVIDEAYSDPVKTGDFNELKGIVKELAQAQKDLAQVQQRTEQRIEQLAQAQEELAQSQKELLQARKETEKSLQSLAMAHKETRRQLGGLSMTVGYILENEAYKALPALLERDFGITVTGQLRRRWVADEDSVFEVNIFGEGTRNGKKVILLGECKAQLSKCKVDSFIRKKPEPLGDVFDDELFPVFVCHLTGEPDVEKYIREKGLALYYSYDF